MSEERFFYEDFLPGAPESERKGGTCRWRWIAPAGGNPIHDEFARYVAVKHGNPTFATLNYRIEKDGIVADFDHYNSQSNEFFEAKTRHEILFREWAYKQPEVVARLIAQAEKQFELMIQCASPYPSPRLIWYFDNREVAGVARHYLGYIVDEVRHVPWIRRLPEIK